MFARSLASTDFAGKNYSLKHSVNVYGRYGIISNPGRFVKVDNECKQEAFCPTSLAVEGLILGNSCNRLHETACKMSGYRS